MTEPTHAYERLAMRIRAHVLRMVHTANASHVGTCLSMADMLAVLYGGVMRVDAARPTSPDRDRFILSKGHGAAAVYAVLAECGFFPAEDLGRYCANGSMLVGHVSHGVPGVEVTTGSLGHGLSIGAGFALGAKHSRRVSRTFVMLSDGECDEGSTWEAALFAAHHRLDNLVAIVDYNKIQSFGTVTDVLGLEPICAKWCDFGWSVREINGHSFDEIGAAFTTVPFDAGRPSCVVAHTVKGKGVTFMENQLAWHYKSPNEKQLHQALSQLGVSL